MQATENSDNRTKKLRSTNYGVQITDYKLRITNYGLQITDYKLRITNYKLGIINYNYKSQLQIVISNTPPQLLPAMRASYLLPGHCF